MTNCRSPVLVAIKKRGLPHAPWMWRQISNMPSLNLRVMYWLPPEEDGAPLTSVPVHVLDAEPTPYNGRGRWALRVANLRGRNFYAARGREYREIRRLIQLVDPSSLLCYYGEIALREREPERFLRRRRFGRATGRGFCGPAASISRQNFSLPFFVMQTLM